ncbi:hypothetical protein CDD82_4986 [Ophiocordyceps australis]|uniref:Essential protein Yae1 N-terminal domain-containing protein n=1 Tax=Ophiocordyceps australis TaxID=1399860 RepID=A0A2C5Y8C7_9HYPO|nr:hypothetical protein CDD82_4986 [Ophiocordyceps australis]
MSDALENVLDLENDFYQQGYREGLADGSRAGRIEGRSVGMQNGFDKFLECGRLAAKAIVWANRLPLPPLEPDQGGNAFPTDSKKSTCQVPTSDPAHRAPIPAQHASERLATRTLPPLVRTSLRLDKNIRAIYALVEPATLSTLNTDEAVNEFDDRIKRARGKLKVVERLIS